MNCQNFEPLIALYAGGDLDQHEIARVESHLAECAGCRQLLEDLQESQTVLAELASEPIDAALLAMIRSGVGAGIGQPRRIVWPWVAAFAAAAALVIAVFPHKTAPQSSSPVVMQVSAPLEAEVVQSKAPVPKQRRVVRRAPITNTEPLVVKMLTDDPDIVIIWLVDKQGD